MTEQCSGICCGHFISVLIMNSVLQYIEFKVDLTLSLDFFIDFLNTLLNMATSGVGIKSKPLSTSEKLNIIKWMVLTNAPHTIFVKELSIAVRKVTDGMLGWSDTGEVLRKCYKLYTYSLQICSKF
jgi:hypothetical protein